MRVQEEARQKDRQKMTQSPVGRRKATKSQSPPLDQATAPVSDGPVEPAEEKAARAAEEEIDRALEELFGTDDLPCWFRPFAEQVRHASSIVCTCTHARTPRYYPIPQSNLTSFKRR